MPSTRATLDDHFRLGIFMGILVLAGLGAALIVRLSDLRSGGDAASVPAAAVAMMTDEGARPEWPTADWRPQTLVPASLAEPMPARIESKQPARETARYSGKTFRYVKTVRLRVTAYAPDPRCTWPYDGKTTASGLPVTTNGGRLVAADTSVIPMHAVVRVPGYAGGNAVPVLDRGSAIKGMRMDVLLPTFEKAKAWGVRYVDVKVYEPI